MANLLAVARGRGLGHRLPAGGAARPRLDLPRPGRGLARLADGADVGGHGLLHRHDLCLPEADPALAPSLGAGELSPARADDRGAAAAGAARPLRQAAGAGLLVYRCRARRRSGGQARLLAGHRPRAGDQHGGKRHGPGRAGPRAPAGGAPYRGQLPHEGDGPYHRPQACRQAAPPRHRLRIPAAAAAEPALPRSAPAGGARWWPFSRPFQGCAACCWNAGSSSPRPSTASPSTTVPRRFRRSDKYARARRVHLSSGGRSRIRPRIDRRARCN